MPRFAAPDFVGSGPAPARRMARLCGRWLLFLSVIVFCTRRCGAQSGATFPCRVVLPDGARLVLKPEAGRDRVSVSLFVRMEPDAGPASAVGELVARALFYGSRDRTENGVLALAGQTGGRYEVLRAPDYVAITVVVRPAQLPEVAHLLSDCLKNADFAPRSLAHARDVLREEQARRQDNGLTRGYEAVCETMRPPRPAEDALRRVTQAQAQEYFRRRYGPARTVIALVGAFDPARAVTLFGAFLADYARPLPRRPDGFAPVETSAPEPVPTTEPAPLVYRTLPAPGMSAYALAATAAPAVTHPDYAPFVVLENVLGGGHASRLFQQAREADGLGYKVGALYQADLAGPLAAYLQWEPRPKRSDATLRSPSDAGDVARFLTAQIDGLLHNPASEEEVTRARNFAIGTDARRHERAHDRSFLLGWYETMGLGFAFDADLPRRLAAVTRDDVLRVAKTYLPTRAGVLVLPAPSVVSP